MRSADLSVLDQRDLIFPPSVLFGLLNGLPSMVAIGALTRVAFVLRIPFYLC